MFTGSIGLAFHSNGKCEIFYLRIFIFLVVRDVSLQSLLITETVPFVHPHDGSLALLQTLPVRHRHSPHTVKRGGGTQHSTSLEEKTRSVSASDKIRLMKGSTMTKRSAQFTTSKIIW